jgi:hypothetical protein
MREIFGTWGPELVAYGRQYPLHVVIAALGVTSVVLTAVFGRPSLSGDGSDSGGFYFSDGDGDAGD